MFRLAGIGCAVLLALGLVLVLGIGWVVAQTKVVLDPNAKPEILLPPNQGLIDQVRTTIHQSDTMMQAGERLKGSIQDERIWYLVLKDRKSETTVEAKRSLNWTGSALMEENGVGSGRLETSDGPKSFLLIAGSDSTASGTVVRWSIYLNPITGIQPPGSVSR